MTSISITREVQLEEFKPWLEKEIANVLRPLKDQGKKLIKKLKEKLDDVRLTCGKLEEEGKKEIERERAVRKAKVTEKLSRYFLKQIDKIVFPHQMSFTELDRLHTDLEKTCSNMVRERNAWFRRISPLFIIARKRVDFALSRLAGSISELNSFLSTDYSKAKDLENLLLKVDEIALLLVNLSNYEARRNEIENSRHHIQEKLEKSKQNIESVRSNADLTGLTETNLTIQQLRKQVKHAIRHLRKPFAKFANLTREAGDALSSEEADKLSQYLDDPFIALATEASGYPTLKSILRKIEWALDNGKLKLKSSRLRKGREKIDAILNKNALNDLHQSSQRAYSINREFKSSEKTQVAQRKINQLKRKLAEMKIREDAVEAETVALKRDYEQLLEKVNEKKRVLQKLADETLEERVVIKFG